MSREVPEGWSQRKLGQISDILIGGTPSRANPAYWATNDDEGHPWASIADLKDGTLSSTKERITNAGIKNSNVKLIPPGTVVMSFKLTIGRVAVAARPIYTNEAIAAFLPKSGEIIPEFLRYILPWPPVLLKRIRPSKERP